MAMSSTTESHLHSYSSPPVIIILTVILLSVFFVGFFSVYFFRCFLENVFNSWNLRRSVSGRFVSPSDTRASCGLEPKLVQLFPVFSYSTIRESHYGAECAICLAEFEDDNTIRALSVCCHIFHRECIDLWFQSHNTCPICRLDLNLPPKTLRACTKSFNNIILRNVHEKNEIDDDAVSIDITDDANEEMKSCKWRVNDGSEKAKEHSRLDSTGQYSMEIKEEQDMMKKRMNQEHAKITSALGHNRARSCITFGELSSCPTSAIGNFAHGSSLSVTMLHRQKVN